MKFLSMAAMIASLALFMGCLNDDASVSPLSASSGLQSDSPLGNDNSSPAEDESSQDNSSEQEPSDNVSNDESSSDEASNSGGLGNDDIVIEDENPSDVESDDEIVSDEEAEENNDNVNEDDGSVEEPSLGDDNSNDDSGDDVADDSGNDNGDASDDSSSDSDSGDVADDSNNNSDSGDNNSNDDVAENSDDDQSDETDTILDDDVVIEDENDDERCRKRGNLIKNGSFEVVDGREGLRGKKLDSINKKNWDVFQSLPSKNSMEDSWYTSKGAGIEVQGDMTVAKAPHGVRMVELDSHGARDTNSTMSQDVFLCRGRHVIKFMYYPRTKSLGDNTIEVRINDKVIKSVDMVKDGNWYRIRAPFKVQKKDTYKVSFSAAGKENTLGGLVDKIRLHKKIRRAGVVTTLLSLGDKDNIPSPMIRREIARAIISKTVNFASIKRNPKVLMIKDANHNGESPDDFILTESILKELFGADRTKVITGEVRSGDIAGYDVIYVINPGHPMGSAVTADTVREAIASRKIGIVFAGDDMARGKNFNVSDITGLQYKSNGTSACGVRVDNNRSNNYGVKLRKRFFKKLSPESRVLEYGNDIDHTVMLKKRMKVLAKAIFPGSCGKETPAIVGYKLKSPMRAVESAN